MKILFVCTHNRCRSILAEAICNHFSGGSIEAKSVGSHPAGEVHPLTLKFLAQRCINTEGLQSQSFEELKDWKPDVVITVCDQAAGEVCPVWLDRCVQAHWGLPDPSKVQGTDQEIAEAFEDVIYKIEQRIHRLLDAKLSNLSPAHLKIYLNSLGEME